MKKITGLLVAMVMLTTMVMGQDDDAIQNPTLAVHFFFNDFKSAAAIRSSSLGVALKNQEFGKVKDMSPGLALNFIKGLSRYYDFTTTLAGSFVDYPMPNKAAFGRDFLLLEGDISVRGKLISNKAVVSPYLQLGMGFSKYQGYYGAFVPIGAGLQVNMFSEAYLLINAQYRVPITETTNYHFWYGIGLAGNIGKKKKE
jgi:hypothetical protein